MAGIGVLALWVQVFVKLGQGFQAFLQVLAVFGIREGLLGEDLIDALADEVLAGDFE